MTTTGEAIRARQEARRERALARVRASKAPLVKAKKAKKEKAVEERTEVVVLTEADSLADLKGEPRPDNPSVPVEQDDDSAGS